MKSVWYNSLWLFSVIYLALGLFNILFAWLGLICFFWPLLIALGRGEKTYCNRYCGRGQMLSLLGRRLKLSPYLDMPAFLRSRTFRYGFLLFFSLMFALMLWNTWRVFSAARPLDASLTLLWTFKVPWAWAAPENAAPWTAQFAFGLYSIMLTSTILGIIMMRLWKPRSWCVCCPMGTATQLICRLKASPDPKFSGGNKK